MNFKERNVGRSRYATSPILLNDLLLPLPLLGHHFSFVQYQLLPLPKVISVTLNDFSILHFIIHLRIFKHYIMNLLSIAMFVSHRIMFTINYFITITTINMFTIYYYYKLLLFLYVTVY